MYSRVFALADKVPQGPARARAMVPQIRLRKPEDHAQADDRLVRAPRGRASQAVAGRARGRRPTGSHAIG